MSKTLFSALFTKQPAAPPSVTRLFLLFFISIFLFPSVVFCNEAAFTAQDAGQSDLFSPLSEPGAVENILSFDINEDISRPALRLLYTASTWGETKPCPTCRTAYGGLDRRSAYFAARRNEKSPVLVIAGPDEFLADAPRYTRKTKTGTAQPQDTPEDARPPAMEAPLSLAAHMALHVDAGFMSPRAAAWMEDNAGATPPGFHVVQSTPVSRLIPSPAGPIGVVFFPHGQGEAGIPTETQIKSVLAAGTALRAKAVLLIGVSPWGYDAEKSFLRQGEGIFHLLLGGGDGMPFAQAIATECPSILWSRPDSMGRAITDISLLELPPSATSGGRAQWLEGISFKARLVFLDDSYPSDPQMRQILR